MLVFEVGNAAGAIAGPGAAAIRDGLLPAWGTFFGAATKRGRDISGHPSRETHAQFVLNFECRRSDLN